MKVCSVCIKDVGNSAPGSGCTDFCSVALLLKAQDPTPLQDLNHIFFFSFPRNANFNRKPLEEAGCGEQCSAVNSYRDINRLWAKQINLRHQVLAIIWSGMMYRCVYWYRWSCKAAFSDSSQSSAAMTTLTKLPCSALRLFVFFFFGIIDIISLTDAPAKASARDLLPLKAFKPVRQSSQCPGADVLGGIKKMEAGWRQCSC